MKILVLVKETLSTDVKVFLDKNNQIKREKDEFIVNLPLKKL